MVSTKSQTNQVFTLNWEMISALCDLYRFFFWGLNSGFTSISLL